MDFLLIVRGLAAIAVVLWHTAGYHGTFPPALNIPGRTAVWIFFGISGYVIAHGFLQGRYTHHFSSLANFYRNRILRIYPLFLLLSVLAWITMTVASGVSPIGFRDIPAQLFAVQFNHDYKLNGIFWTLGIELQFYLVAPLLIVPLLIKPRIWIVLALGIYAGLVYGNRSAVAHGNWTYDGRNLFSNLPHFFIGMLGCRLVAGLSSANAAAGRGPFLPDRKSDGKPANATVAAISLLGASTLLACTNWMYHRDPKQFWADRGIFYVDALILLLVIGHSYCERQVVGEKYRRGYAIFALLGTLSYGIYAWHGYFINHVVWLADQVLATLLLSGLAAFVSFRLIESPALKLKWRPT